jgi:hypothetical protein
VLNLFLAILLDNLDAWEREHGSDAGGDEEVTPGECDLTFSTSHMCDLTCVT